MNVFVKLSLIGLCSLLFSCGGGGGGCDSSQPQSSTLVSLGTIKSDGLQSTALHRQMSFRIYLPPAYSATTRYPVLYLLYGYGGNQDSFFGGFLDLHSVADRLIAARSIDPLIIVVPDYANSFAVNSTPEQGTNTSGGTIGLYEDYLMQELVPYVDHHYSTLATREKRSVGGFSMGGYAALYLGFRYPDKFSKVGGHSAALWDYTDTDQFTGQRDWLYPTPALRAQRDPLLLATTVDLRSLKVYLDAGSSDALLAKDRKLAGILQSSGVNVEWHEGSGGHERAYWQSKLENYLRFYN